MKALQIETGNIPGDAAANLPTTGAEAEKREGGGDEYYKPTKHSCSFILAK